MIRPAKIILAAVASAAVVAALATTAGPAAAHAAAPAPRLAEFVPAATQAARHYEHQDATTKGIVFATTGSCPDITRYYCWIVATSGEGAYGVNHGVGVRTNTSPSLYSFTVQDSPWGLFYSQATGLCWNWAPNIDQIVNDSCVDDANEYFYYPAACGHQVIKNYYEGLHYAVWFDNINDVYLQFVTAACNSTMEVDFDAPPGIRAPARAPVLTRASHRLAA